MAQSIVPDPKQSIRLLVLGGATASVPVADALQVSDEPKLGFDIAVLVGQAGATDLWSVLKTGRALLAPVIDFSGNHVERSDVSFPTLTAASLREALLAVAPILRLAGAIGDISNLPDSDGLYALGMAHSRQKEILAAWSASTRQDVYYPLLGMRSGDRKTMESLADLDLLQRTFFGRTNLCTHCGSARLNAFEACGKCGSANLRIEHIVHHYSCGAQAPESAFLHGELLICPKCRKELRHIGVDYDRPGSVFVCVACGESTADPSVQFVCLDCTKLTPSDSVETLDWFNYRITTDGISALKAKRLPNPNMMRALESYSGSLPMRDFLLVARNEHYVAVRYDRAFSLARLRVENYEELQKQHGSLVLDESIRLFVRLISETLRKSDIVTATAQREILIALPETEAANVEKILARLGKKVKEVIALPLRLASSVGGRDEAAAMLESFK